MKNFSPANRVEIPARLLKEILLKSNCRLHGEEFSPGCNSARAEKQEIIWLPDSPETLRLQFHVWCRDISARAEVRHVIATKFQPG